MGPEIRELWLEDGVLHVACGEVKEIFLRTDRRFNLRLKADGEPLTQASFDLKTYFGKVHECGSDDRGFVRLVLVDGEGRCAMTRAYFADELAAAARGLAE